MLGGELQRIDTRSTSSKLRPVLIGYSRLNSPHEAACRVCSAERAGLRIPPDGRRNLLLRPSRMALDNHHFVFSGTYPAGSAEPAPKK